MSKYPQLDEYVKTTRAQGFTDNQIKGKLIISGYTQADIDEVFKTNIDPIPQSEMSAQAPVFDPLANTMTPSPSPNITQESVVQEKVVENPIISDQTTQTQVVSEPIIVNQNISQTSEPIKIKVNFPPKNNPDNVNAPITNPNPQPTIESRQQEYGTQQFEDVKITEDIPTNVILKSTTNQNFNVEDKIKPTIMSVTNVANTTAQSTRQIYHVPQSPSGGSGFLKFVVTVLLISMIGGAGVYAYMNDMIPFIKKAPYSQENFLSGIFQKIATIESANYVFSARAYMEDQTEDITAFPEIQNQEELENKFERDIKRITLLNNIDSLKYDTKTFLYPNSISASQIKKIGESYDIDETILNEIIPTYKSINTGKGYEVKVSLETQEAIDILQTRLKEDLERKKEFSSSPYSSFVSKVDTKIVGKTVTVNNPEGESDYLSIGYQFPKSFAQEIFGMISKLSPDFDANAQLDIEGEETPEGVVVALNILAEGDVGDLTYKFSVDMIKDQKDMFVRINNFPSIILEFLPITKGEWILFSEKDIADQVGYSEDISEGANDLNKFKEQAKEIFIQSLKIAEEQKILTFINKPVKETLDIGKTYKYSLKIDETKAILYITEIINFIKTNKDFELSQSSIEDLDELLTTIQDPQLAKEIQYVLANSTYNIWVDSEGYPIKMESKTVILPSNKSKTLIDKQFVTEFGFVMKNINQPIKIDRPAEYKTFEEIMQNLFMPKATLIEE